MIKMWNEFTCDNECDATARTKSYHIPYGTIPLRPTTPPDWVVTITDSYDVKTYCPECANRSIL